MVPVGRGRGSSVDGVEGGRRFRQDHEGRWFEFKNGRPVAGPGEKRGCPCGHQFVAREGSPQLHCSPSCAELAAIRNRLPRFAGKKPRTEQLSGRCLNCNRRLTGAHRGLFWCDNERICELEWRTRLAYWEWCEAKDDLRRRIAG